MYDVRIHIHILDMRKLWGIKIEKLTILFKTLFCVPMLRKFYYSYVLH